MTSRRRILPVLLGVLLLAVVAVDVFLLVRKQRYAAETERLRGEMSDVERLTADAIIARDSDREDVMLELLRRQALGDPDLHLSVMLDSSVMILERSNAILRTMPVALGPDRAMDTTPGARRLVLPSGVRSIDRLIDKGDRYPLPDWVWTDRQLPVPDDRADPAFLGEGAIVLNGGTLVYAQPTSGPLADSSWVMPGTIRVKKEDLDAIRPNLVRGMKIYLF